MEPTQTPTAPQSVNMDAQITGDPEAQMSQLLQLVVSQNASDLHLTVGLRPMVRIDGSLHSVGDFAVLTPEIAEGLIFSMVTNEQKELLAKTRELDFSLSLEEKARFRVNAYYQRGYLSAALRLIPTKLRSYAELDLPPAIAAFAQMKQGLVLFAGPTGHGKSTSQAAIIDDINATRAEHIITVEDPIEYMHMHKKSIVNQRELHSDTESFPNALRAALREDPDVVLIGEMRDTETMNAAMTVAETGHLVFATIHTNDAPQTIDRIIDSFPAYQQGQVRAQLSQVLTGVISQRLLPRIGGGRIPVVEIMVATTAVKNLIRESKTHQIPSVIQTSTEEGMVSLEKALAERVQQGLITLEQANLYAGDTKTLGKFINGYS